MDKKASLSQGVIQNTNKPQSQKNAHLQKTNTARLGSGDEKQNLNTQRAINQPSNVQKAQQQQRESESKQLQQRKQKLLQNLQDQDYSHFAENKRYLNTMPAASNHRDGYEYEEEVFEQADNIVEDNDDVHDILNEEEDDFNPNDDIQEDSHSDNAQQQQQQLRPKTGASGAVQLQNQPDKPQQNQTQQQHQEQANQQQVIVDLTKYKGIYYNDENKKFQDDETGAHFEFGDLCNRLQGVMQWRLKLEEKDKLLNQQLEHRNYTLIKNDQKQITSQNQKTYQNMDETNSYTQHLNDNSQYGAPSENFNDETIEERRPYQGGNDRGDGFNAKRLLELGGNDIISHVGSKLDQVPTKQQSDVKNMLQKAGQKQQNNLNQGISRNTIGSQGQHGRTTEGIANGNFHKNGSNQMLLNENQFSEPQTTRLMFKNKFNENQQQQLQQMRYQMIQDEQEVDNFSANRGQSSTMTNYQVKGQFQYNGNPNNFMLQSKSTKDLASDSQIIDSQLAKSQINNRYSIKGSKITLQKNDQQLSKRNQVAVNAGKTNPALAHFMQNTNAQINQSAKSNIKIEGQMLQSSSRNHLKVSQGKSTIQNALQLNDFNKINQTSQLYEQKKTSPKLGKGINAATLIATQDFRAQQKAHTQMTKSFVLVGQSTQLSNNTGINGQYNLNTSRPSQVKTGLKPGMKTLNYTGKKDIHLHELGKLKTTRNKPSDFNPQSKGFIENNVRQLAASILSSKDQKAIQKSRNANQIYPLTTVQIKTSESIEGAFSGIPTQQIINQQSTLENLINNSHKMAIPHNTINQAQFSVLGGGSSSKGKSNTRDQTQTHKGSVAIISMQPQLNSEATRQKIMKSSLGFTKTSNKNPITADQTSKQDFGGNSQIKHVLGKSIFPSRNLQKNEMNLISKTVQQAQSNQFVGSPLNLASTKNSKSKNTKIQFGESGSSSQLHQQLTKARRSIGKSSDKRSFIAKN
eukprot:403334660